MANNIRGGGLFGPTSLFEIRERLGREGEQSSEPPTLNTAHLSHVAALFKSPEPGTEEHRLHQERQKRKLIEEHRASFPLNQFGAELTEETERIEEASRNGTYGVPVGKTCHELAWRNVQARWVEQGIWKEEWADGIAMRRGRWKHEEPLELESESEDDSAAERKSSYSQFGPPLKRAKTKPRRPKSAEELQRSAERRLVREREREASRPFHQFVYQVSKEREQIQDEINSPEDLTVDPCRTLYGNIDYYLYAYAREKCTQDDPDDGRVTDETPHDINTAAYERVKNTWTKRGLWNNEWGLLPGMSWKHEQPLEEMLREKLGDDVGPVCFSPPGDIRYEPKYDREQAPPRSMSRADLPAESNAAPVQASPPGGNRCVTVEVPHWSQNPTPATGPEELLNSNIGHPLEARRRVLSQQEQQAHHWARIQARLPQGQQSGDGQIAHRKSGPGPRRGVKASEARPEARQSSHGLDVPAPPTTAAPAPLRRSRRLQEVANDGGSQSRPR